MSEPLKLEKLLRETGYDTDEALARALAVLVEAKLTRPGKEVIAAEKLPAVKDALAALYPVCEHPDCAREAQRSGLEPVRVQLGSCRACGGSANRRAAAATAKLLKARGVSRVLVVGGTPNLHAELAQLFGGEGLQFTFVDGATGTYTAKDAANHLRWAQVGIVWGSTPLPHKVSKLYTDDPPAHVRMIQVSRRGIEAVCQELRKSFGG